MAVVAAVAGSWFARRQKRKKRRAQKADHKCASGDEGALRRLEKASPKRLLISAAHAFK
jgi:hypothetical protein